jgi:hypothetical protein
MTGPQLTEAVLAVAPGTNTGTIALQLKSHCINDPTKESFPGRSYWRNPQFVTDEPTMRGKRYRLLRDDERQAFLGHPRADLDRISYAQLIDWLNNPGRAPIPQVDEIEDDDCADAVETAESAGGPALLELHLQDYLLRHWQSVFPDLRLYQGEQGREFVTNAPAVGIIDFLATDRDGNFVVVETKRGVPNRQSFGQILGYMGWVAEKLCAEGQTVRGILIVSELTETARLASAAVPNLEIYLYELSFRLTRALPVQHRSSS